eukprot:CAMPEP_0184379656 /NCGR_PEP_ID=MMETSP0007-20130409/4050_1 /TAXON_ID=97485 /ORGANISM="Prymnesium parvum, Strain Texoma1" /LENGTH=47 /DNA_ID= /DNA_START= /DNA_END= /DNA_ORIENTATION=
MAQAAHMRSVRMCPAQKSRVAKQLRFLDSANLRDDPRFWSECKHQDA